MTLYRAVAKAGFDSDRVIIRYRTPRVPSNVPYLVDNVWEYLRPADMPSRRFAAYASPTADMALANASSASADRSDYVVCELDFGSEPVRVAHLNVVDARHHPDLRAIAKAVLAALGDLEALPFAEKGAIGALFMPSLAVEHLQQLIETQPRVAAAIEAARSVSTFWADATATVQDGGENELFFEPSTQGYRLRPLA